MSERGHHNTILTTYHTARLRRIILCASDVSIIHRRAHVSKVIVQKWSRQVRLTVDLPTGIFFIDSAAKKIGIKLAIFDETSRHIHLARSKQTLFVSVNRPNVPEKCSWRVGFPVPYAHGTKNTLCCRCYASPMTRPYAIFSSF